MATEALSMVGMGIGVTEGALVPGRPTDAPAASRRVARTRRRPPDRLYGRR